MPLSNILVSKRITPSNPEESPYQIRKKVPVPILRKDSSNKLIFEEKILIEDFHNHTEETNRRTSTSHSQRMRKKAHNKEVFISEEKPIKIIKSDEYCFVLGKGNNNEELVGEILLDRKIWR